MSGDEPHGEAADGVPSGGTPQPTVLVVDDDPAVRAWAEGVLVEAGIGVATAASGRDALRLVADGRVHPSVLLTDIELPGMTGVELAARLAAMRPGLRVVMMTGDPARADEARIHSTLVATVLLKPMRGPELIAAVRPDATAPVG